jgi:single-strand DNA-binding protein
MSAITPTPCNIVALVGRVARNPSVRTLASGEESVEFDVTIPGPPSETVNVVVPSASGAAELPGGTDVVVVGRVRRRFFRAGGATLSRTEVVAAEVVPTRRTKRAATILRATADQLQSLTDPEP